jgi:hypothetical protein
VEVERLAALAGEQADRCRDVKLLPEAFQMITQEDAQLRSVFRPQPIAQLLGGWIGVNQLMVAKDEDRQGQRIDDHIEAQFRAPRGSSHEA